jgi:hypothetical protein
VKGRCTRSVLGLVFGWACAAAVWAQASSPAGNSAQAALADPAERARLAAQREAITARFAAEERACRERFVVTACLDDVRVRRRDALAPVRLRELQLGDADRRARAEERKAALAEKQRAARQRDASLPAPEVRLRAAPAAAASAPRPAQRAPQKTDDSAHRASEAAERVKGREQRVQASEAAQERVRKRLADRAASGKAAAPLPPPELPASAARR